MAFSGAAARFGFFEFSSSEIRALEGNPPSVSAFQSFEAFLLLTALERFPQALTTLATALESAAKATEQEGPDIRSDLAKALGTLNSLVPKDFRFRLQPTPKEFREKRNDIAHFGFSPEDDDVSIRCSFGVGVPLFAAWATSQHSVGIFERLGGGLGHILAVAVPLVQTPATKLIGPKDALRGVRSWVVHHIRGAFLADWENAVLNHDESSVNMRPGSGFGFREDRLQELQSKDPFVTIDCPVCSVAASFVLQLNDDVLSSVNPTLTPLEAECIYCNFHAPKSAQRLLVELCRSQLTDELLEKTRSEYGIRQGRRK